MERSLVICLLGLWINGFTFCKKPFAEKIIKGDVYNTNFQEYTNQDIDDIFLILKSIFQLIEKKELKGIGEYIHQEKGIYIDLKAYKTKDEFFKELENKNGYLYMIYLNTDLLKKYTQDNTQISLYDLIDFYTAIKADFFIITKEDCEVKFTILENPIESYRFNNPYFIKINNRWYLYRLF